MTTPKGTTINQEQLRNQKRNNSAVEIDDDIEQLLPMSDKSSSTQNSILSFGGNSFLQSNNNPQNTSNNEFTNNNRKNDSHKNQQNNSSNQQNKGNNNQNYNTGQTSSQKSSSSNNNSSGQTKIQEQINQPTNKQGQQPIYHTENNSKQGQNHEIGQRKKQVDEQQQYKQDNKILPNDMILDKGNRDYIDQMIKQKKQSDDSIKSKKPTSAKTAVPSFMKGIHIMQQLQQQQQQQMQQAQNKQIPVQQQQQSNNDTVRINQKQNNAQQQQQQQQKNEVIEFNINEQQSQVNESKQPQNKNEPQIQPSNQDEKLTSRKTIGSQQPKLFDQFFRNSSQHNSISQTNITQQNSHHNTQTQRSQQNQQEKAQHANTSNNQPDSKKSNMQINTNSNLQQTQQQISTLHSIQTPSNTNQITSQVPQQDHQNHHLSTINNNQQSQNKNKRNSHTSIHIHQSLLEQQQQQTQPHHQKKDSSLFNSQQSTLLNNSIGNISPTAQFNNLDQSQFNISNISNIQNVSNNVSSIHNQSNLMVNYNSNNPMNISNANSLMSFQKQFEESSPENARKSTKDTQNNNFLNSLSVFIDYFNTTYYETSEKLFKPQQRIQNTNKELVQENLQLKSQLIQLEEKLKETETSRKILMGELSREKNDFKNKLQVVMKQNNDIKVYLQQVNFKFHQTQQYLAKEKIEHDNTKFTLSKVLQNKSLNMQNSNFTNKVDSFIRPQKMNGQTTRKSNSQQFPTQETYINQSSNKLGMSTIPMQQYLKAYPYSYQNQIDSSVNYTQGKQISYPGQGSNLYTNTNSVVSPQNNIMNNQHQLMFDVDQIGVSRIVDIDEKIIDPLYLNQSQISQYPNQMLLQQDIPMFMEKQYGPSFGVQNQQLNEFEELQCKDFNIDDSIQNIENDLYQDNGNMIIRDDFTDNTTDFINLNNQASTMPMQSSSTATGSLRINSLNQQKYGSINNQIYTQGQQVLQNNQQQLKNNELQDDVYDEEQGEDMNLSDNFNLDTDNQLNEDIAMINIDNQNKGIGQYDPIVPIQQDLSIIENQQYYDFQNKLLNTYDNSSFKFSTHRDAIDQNIKNINQQASTTYKKGACSLDEEHLYQMMKLQHHPNQYEINKLNLNLKAQANLNANSINHPLFLKSQIKKQQQINPQNRNSYGARTMSLSYQKPQFSSQQFEQFQLFQNQKQKNSFHQQQFQQPYANYQ